MRKAAATPTKRRPHAVVYVTLYSNIATHAQTPQKTFLKSTLCTSLKVQPFRPNWCNTRLQWPLLSGRLCPPCRLCNTLRSGCIADRKENDESCLLQSLVRCHAPHKNSWRFDRLPFRQATEHMIWLQYRWLQTKARFTAGRAPCLSPCNHPRTYRDPPARCPSSCRRIPSSSPRCTFSG